MRYIQKWIDSSTWGCMSHVPMPRLPANCAKCWFCGQPRPPLADGQVLPPFVKPETTKALHLPNRKVKKVKPSFISVAETSEVRPKCAWHDCVKTAAANSKYCSRNCSNKNARARHKATRTPTAAE